MYRWIHEHVRVSSDTQTAPSSDKPNCIERLDVTYILALPDQTSFQMFLRRDVDTSIGLNRNVSLMQKRKMYIVFQLWRPERNKVSSFLIGYSDYI